MIQELKEIYNVIKQNNSFFFNLWFLLIFFIFLHIWKYVIIFITIATFYITVNVLSKKKITIKIKKNSPTSVLWSYFKLNIISTYKCKTFRSHVILNIIMKIVFKHLMGFSIKMLKCSIKYAVIARNEFIIGKLITKKIKLTILKTFLKNTINMLIFEEFSKPIDICEKGITRVLGFEKEIYVYIYEDNTI